MKKNKLTLAALFGFTFFFSNELQAQLTIIGENYVAEDVNNQGVVVGSLNLTDTFMWNPEDGAINIGSVTSGYKSGYTLISENNVIISQITNPENNLKSPAVYNQTTSQWSFINGLGGSLDNNSGTPWGISDDGTTVVGLSYLENSTNSRGARAVKWDLATGSITNLGTTVTDRSTRGNVITPDLSTIGGYQDLSNGYRQGAIWKNGEQILISEPSGWEVSEVMGLSADGLTAVGAGDFQPYVWTENSFTYIGHPNASYSFRGGASAISADGTTVIGYYRPTPGNAHFGEGFIWTESTGRINLNEYVESLGIDTYGYTLSLPAAMSPDGTKIVGLAKPSGNSRPYGFYLDLSEYLNTSNQVATSSTIKIFPNPAVDVLNISGLKADAKISITNILGQKVKAEEIQNGKVNVQNLSKGTYIITISENGITTNHKFIKK